MKGIKKLFKGIKRVLIKGALAGLLLHGGTQLAYWANDFYHHVKPSSIRTDFKRQFGFPLKGWRDDIEGNGKHVSIIAEVIEKEKQEREFELDSIRIRNGNYLKRNILDQIETLVANPFSGYYIADRIIINDYTQRYIIHHEIKHVKTFDIVKKHPELLDKWKKLAIDKKGKSLYLTEVEQICSSIKGLEFLVDKNKQVYSENEKLGFVSDYARRNVYEDIAETCERTENFDRRFMDRLMLLIEDGENRNEIIAKKIALAQDYKLIPKEFIEYVKLKNIFYNNSGWHDFDDLDKTENFMKQSENFLRKYPNSVYETYVRLNRAIILDQDCEIIKQKNNVEDVVREYKAVLSSKYKDSLDYTIALRHLFEIYRWKLNDERASKIFNEAYDEYFKRFKGGDVELPRRGVNDYLLKEGIKLD